MSGIEDDPGLCVCADCQNAREQGTGETEGDSGIIGRLGEVIRAQVDVIAERDATISRLWAQLNEATNVPEVFCTCNGMDSWTGIDQAPNGPEKVWRCDTCGRLIELSRSAPAHRFVVPDAPTEPAPELEREPAGYVRCKGCCDEHCTAKP